MSELKSKSTKFNEAKQFQTGFPDMLLIYGIFDDINIFRLNEHKGE